MYDKADHSGTGGMTNTLAQAADIDLFSPEVRTNPYPCYQRLRSENPLAWNHHHSAWIVSCYEHAVALLTDSRVQHWAVGAAAQNTSHHFPRILGDWMNRMDPRTHDCLRRFTAPVFTRKALNGMSAHLQTVAERILDDAQQHGTLDVVNDYADPIALAAIARLFGVDDAQAERFRHLARGMIGQLFVAVESTQTQTGNHQAVALIEFLAQLLAAEQTRKPDTLIAALRDAQREDATLSDEKLLGFLILFLFAGQENIMNFIGNAAYALVSAPAQLARLRKDTGLLANAVEELLRFESPVQFMTVVATEDIRIDNTTLAQGDQIMICIGSANRDEARFTHAGQLDITRNDQTHLSFGRGPLTCIGSILARLEGAVAIGSLARRIQRPSIQGPLKLRRNPPVLRGFSALELSFDT